MEENFIVFGNVDSYDVDTKLMAMFRQRLLDSNKKNARRGYALTKAEAALKKIGIE